MKLEIHHFLFFSIPQTLILGAQFLYKTVYTEVLRYGIHQVTTSSLINASHGHIIYGLGFTTNFHKLLHRLVSITECIKDEFIFIK